MLRISTFQNVSADTQQTVVLEGQSVIIRFVYNGRNDYFTLTLTDQNGNTLYGIKIVPYWLLLNQYKGFTDLVGDFIVLKADEDAGNEITYDNFGTGFTFNYLNESEILTWRVANGF